MIYTVGSHSLLGEKARALFGKDPSAFADQVAMAAEWLEIHDIETWSAAELIRAERYLVMQLNYQLELKPEIFTRLQESSSASHNNITYRQEIGLVSPQAAAGIETLLEDASGKSGWLDCNSVRANVVR